MIHTNRTHSCTPHQHEVAAEGFGRADAARQGHRQFIGIGHRKQAIAIEVLKRIGAASFLVSRCCRYPSTRTSSHSTLNPCLPARLESQRQPRLPGRGGGAEPKLRVCTFGFGGCNRRAWRWEITFCVSRCADGSRSSSARCGSFGDEGWFTANRGATQEEIGEPAVQRRHPLSTPHFFGEKPGGGGGRLQSARGAD